MPATIRRESKLNWIKGALMECWKTAQWIRQTQILLDSYHKFLGRELMDRSGNHLEQSRILFEAPFIVVSHGTQADPILNFGNQVALDLWEMDLESFLCTPSRLTAEPVHRDERARLLERTTRDGYVDDYQGIRISKTGKRFRIERAIVWNLLDSQGNHAGQAASFTDWTPLTD